MTDYKNEPLTTEEIRYDFAQTNESDIGFEAAYDWFNQWLAAHDREVAATALRDASADPVLAGHIGRREPGHHTCYCDTANWLRERAAVIQGESE